jgi:hypothetical protein
MRARAGQLEQELRELGTRVDAESAEVFDVPWGAWTPTACARCRSCSSGRARASSRTRAPAARPSGVAARQLAEAAGRAPEPPLIGRVGAGAIFVVGLVLLIASFVTGLRALALAGRAPARRRRHAARQRVRARSVAKPVRPRPGRARARERREAEALAALRELLAGLPARTPQLERTPLQIANGIERIQQLLREAQGRDVESARLRRGRCDPRRGAGPPGGRSARPRSHPIRPRPRTCSRLPRSRPGGGRRRSSAPSEELARLERTRAREDEALARLRAEAPRCARASPRSATAT